MAGRSTDFIDIQNDDHEINLHFQEFGGTSSSMVENDGQKEQTFYFSNYPESHEDDQQREVSSKRRLLNALDEDQVLSKKLKETKLDAKNISVSPVVSDEIFLPQFIKLIVLQIRDKMLISSAIQIVSQHYPCPTLLHLKRVRKISMDNNLVYIIYLDTVDKFDITESSFACSHDSYCNLIELSSDVASYVFSKLHKNIDISIFTDRVFVSNAVKFPPKIRTLYDKVSPFWPCSFHEDMYLSKLLSGTYFDETEKENIIKYMNLVIQLAESVDPIEGEKKAVVLVKNADYFWSSVKCCGRDKRFINPTYHSCMVAIDVVAFMQEGGALPRGLIESEIAQTNLLLHDMQCNVNSVAVIVDENDYICTDYIAYMTDEPCCMCAMALLHSRVKRIFYLHNNPSNGALTSVCKLHTLQGINHRYEVFHIKLKDDEESESTKPSHSFWSFEYYQQFFNVDSKQVGDRILWSMVPKPGVNYLKSYIRPNPDLYGPFWICVTLVFTTAITGNLANYLQTPDSYKWRYNFHKVTLATSSIFSYAWLVPILLWGMLIWRDSKANLSLLELICLYGYSLGIFVPVSLLWMIPLKWLQWCLGIVASVLSGSVLVRTILSTVHPKAKKVAVALSTVILILHAALALGFMLYFFYPPPVTTPPLGPKTNSTEGPKTNSTEALVGMNRKDSYNNTSKVTREVIAKVTENLKLNIRKVEEEAVNKKSQEETVSKKEQTDVPNTMNKEDKVDEKETINNIREEAVNKLKKEETLSVSEERSGKMLEVDNNLSHVEAFDAGNQAIVSKKKEETQALKISSFNFTKNTI